MTRSSSQKNDKRSKKKNTSQGEAWLPTRGGLIAVGAASLLLAIWVTVQGMKVADLGESLLWGVVFGASIWVIFGIVFAVNKFLRGR